MMEEKLKEFADSLELSEAEELLTLLEDKKDIPILQEAPKVEPVIQETASNDIQIKPEKNVRRAYIIEALPNNRTRIIEDEA